MDNKRLLNFVEKANLKHGNTYDYSLVKYENILIKVIIKCNIHGIFEMRPNNHLNGQGCKICGIIKAHNKTRSNKDKFIEDAKKVHGTNYDYTLVEYIDSKKKVIIICKEFGHKPFLQSPGNHLSGSKCPKCASKEVGEKSKLTNKEFIIRAISKHGMQYDYSLIHYENANTIVDIGCTIHGIFNQKASSHLNGNGCPKCGIIKAHSKIKSNNEEFINKANCVHFDIYDYSKVKYYNSITKVIIGCIEHGPFHQLPSSHLQGSGCPKCYGGIKYNKETFFEKVNEIHVENRYDYKDSEFVDMHTPIVILCNKHGYFYQLPSNHITGRGCYMCGRESIGNSSRKPQELFIEDSIKIHGILYDYSNINYINSNTKVSIGCYIHGIFTQTPNHHLGGQGCRDCSIIKNAENNKSSTEEFIKKAIKKHGKKYEYSSSKYINATSQIEIICKKPNHGVFIQRVNNHLTGQGCPRCVYSGYSKKAIRYLKYIETRDNIYIHHAEQGGEFIIPGSKLKADGYCSETNTIYEFHGTIFHGDPRKCNHDDFNYFKKKYGELYKKTKQKEAFIIENGYNLVVMWEIDWDIFERKNKI